MQLSHGNGDDADARPSASISFTPLSGGSGVELFDPIERHRCEFRTPEPVDPVPAGTDAFLFPVDDAVAIRTGAVELPTVVGVHVRDEDGRPVAEADHFAHEELPAGRYSVELTTQVKLYLRVDAPVTVTADLERTRIEFGEPTRVLVGARSRHERPAATITTTDDPADLMVALSHLGSALKTTSPERSYPTLRGHPPTLELGDSLDVPDCLAAPDTGVRLELPPDHEHLFVAAPLAFYLGAEVVPGDRPRLVTDEGFEHALDGHRGFEAEVERTLKQTFFLDCLVRTEGYYRVDLHERTAVEPSLDLDLAALYDASLAEQVAAYLSVPYDAVEDELPEWKLTTHVAPRPENVELLPFLVDDLAVVRTPQVQEATGTTEELAAVSEFMRDDEFTRSAGESADPGPATLQPERTGSLEQAWVGSGAPVGASKPTAESFRNRLDRTPADGDIEVTVVCNDPEMAEERDVVTDVYGSREDLPFDVTVRHELSRAELRALLAENVEFLHYIGHIDDDGFQCADGKLSATGLDHVGVDAFLLNACRSYEQGLALVEAGAIGGVVTLRDVINSGAVAIGRTLSRLLNCGFPLRAALNVASDESVVGSQYVVVGDGGFALAQSESGTPYVCEVAPVEDGYELGIDAYPTSDRGMGSIAQPHIDGQDRYFLNSGRFESFRLSPADLQRFLGLESVPVLVDGDLHWSDEFAVEDL